MELRGDFTQKSTIEDSYSYSRYGFNASGTHKVILSGSGEQIISFADPGDSKFNILEVKNNTGKVVFNELPVRGSIIGDITSDSDINLYYPSFDLSNQSIKAPNLYWYLSGDIKLLDGAKIDSNLIHTSGNLFVCGNAEITGDYYITNAEKTGYSTGRLYMTDEKGYLLVHGDFKVDVSTISEAGYGVMLNAGTMELRGDFTQKSTIEDGGSYSRYGFNASGTHKVILSGSGEQIVSFADPTYSGFNILINKNANRVIFETEYRYNELQIIHVCDYSSSMRCQECGELAPLKFYGWSLTLQDNIALNYAIDARFFADGCYTMPSVVFTIGDRVVTVAEYNTVKYAGYYIFTLTDIAPHQMGMNIHVSMLFSQIIPPSPFPT